MPRKETIKELVKALRSRRKELLSKLHNAVSGSSNTHVGESESIREALGSRFQLAESDSQELARIDAALLRHRNRTFGVCKSCKSDIPVARLRAVPQADRCVACQEKADAGELDDETVDHVTIDTTSFPEVLNLSNQLT